VCQQLGQPRGCLIGWVKVATYLPGTDIVVLHPPILLPTYVRSRARGNASSGTGRGMERQEFLEIASASFFEVRQTIALCDRNWQFRAARPRDMIPKRLDLNLKWISARYESVDNARNSSGYA
jgi:hypothetical protein